LLGELLEGKLHEQFLWGGAGNGRGNSAPRQSLTRQLLFKALKQSLRIKTFVGTTANALKTQIWTALIALLVIKYLRMKATFGWSLSNLVALLRQQLFVYRDLWAWLNDPFQVPPG
jgi:IS4 transposase